MNKKEKLNALGFSSYVLLRKLHGWSKSETKKIFTPFITKKGFGWK